MYGCSVVRRQRSCFDWVLYKIACHVQAGHICSHVHRTMKVSRLFVSLLCSALFFSSLLFSHLISSHLISSHVISSHLISHCIWNLQTYLFLRSGSPTQIFISCLCKCNHVCVNVYKFRNSFRNTWISWFFCFGDPSGRDIGFAIENCRNMFYWDQALLWPWRGPSTIFQFFDSKNTDFSYFCKVRV